MRKVIYIPKWYEKNRIIELRKEAGLNQTQVAQKIGCVLKTYQNYEQGHNFPTLEYAAALAELYEVSIDYLLGRSDCRNVDNSYINKLTGLCDNAISTLKLLNMNNGSTVVGHNEIGTLNILLSDSFVTIAFLNGLQDFLNTRYRIPVFHTGEYEVVDNFTDDSHPESIDNVAVPQCIVPNNDFDVIKGNHGYSDTYLLTLAKAKDKPYDNYQIPLTDDFFEGIALKTIEKALQDLRKTFYAKTDANETT